MAKTLQFKRYRTSILAATTGSTGELIVDTNTSILTVHDGVTIGGTRLATESSVANSNAAIASLNTYTISAYSKANAATTLAQAAFDTANTDVTNLSANVTILNGINTTQNTNISAVDAYATGAYGKANAVGGKMESAYARANSAAITADAAYVFGLTANAAGIQANVAIVLAQAAFDSSNTFSTSITDIQGVNTTQNTNISAIDSFAGSAYNQANSANVLSQAAFDKANSEPVAFSAYNQANSEPVAFSAYAKANTVASDLSNFNSLYASIELTQNTNINAVDSFAGSAYNQANSANILAQAAFSYANTLAGGSATDNVARVLAQASFDSANTKLSLSGGIIAGNVTANSVIANNSIYAPVYYSTGGASRLELTDINLAVITVAGQEYKFGASGIESSLGIFGGSFGGNKLSLNNETTLISNRYDIVKIQTGTNGSISNEFNFSNNHLIFPDNTYQNTAFTDAQVTNISNADTKAQAAFDKANTAAEIITQNAQSTDYTLQRADAGKHIYYTQASNTVLYIPTTSNVAFSNGTTVMIISQTPGANVTISPNVGVTMYLAGNTTSASRNVTSYGMATLIQVAANTWFINGTGVV